MWRLSLRELLVLVALVALAIVSLKYASSAWQIGMTSVTLLIFVGAAIVACVDRKSRQAFAIGMVLTMSIYGVLIGYGRSASTSNTNRELSTNGRLPTTRLLSALHRGVSRQYYADQNTGEEIPGFDPNKDRVVVSGQGGQGSVIRTRPRIPGRRVVTPSSDSFLRIGHCWWALLLGYAGGRFARYVYLRRADEAEK